MNEKEFFKELLNRFTTLRYITYQLMNRPNTEDYCARINGKPLRNEINFTSDDIMKWVYEENLNKIIERERRISDISKERMLVVLQDEINKAFDIMIEANMVKIADINPANLYLEKPKYSVECIRVKLKDTVKEALKELEEAGTQMRYKYSEI